MYRSKIERARKRSTHLIGVRWCSTIVRRELTVGKFIFVVYNLSVKCERSKKDSFQTDS